MRIGTRVAAAAGVAAVGVMTLGAPAFADSVDNNGVNVVNDNNISAVPVQACGNDIGAIVGVILKLGSEQTTSCVNAPIVDHAQQR
ncbi:hypothetical protein A8924_6567 [Saccharopolyspora erythraea NRRL 2338]|nr:hypothetical protein A8924_6567 [Saccharopolyspora erythraea NRRL 2338]